MILDQAISAARMSAELTESRQRREDREASATIESLIALLDSTLNQDDTGEHGNG
jgi:hypothetical protein